MMAAFIRSKVGKRNISVKIKKNPREFVKLIVPISVFVIAGVFRAQSKLSIK